MDIRSSTQTSVQVQSHVVHLMDLRTCHKRCPGRSWTCTVSPWFPTTPSLSLPRWSLYRLDFLLQIVNILGKFIYITLPLLAKMVLTLVLLKFLLLQKWLSFTPGGDRAIQPGSGPGLQHPRVLGPTSKSPVLWPNQHFSLGLAQTKPYMRTFNMFAPTLQGNSLSCDMRDAFASNDFTDMTIVCDKREFHCHKFLLAARWSTNWYLEAPILGMNSNQFCLSLEKAPFLFSVEETAILKLNMNQSFVRALKKHAFYPALFPGPRCSPQCSATSSWRSRTAELTWRRSTERPWSFSSPTYTPARFVQAF